jgi:ABC-type proline/glycine betaine transport system permease subunit
MHAAAHQPPVLTTLIMYVVIAAFVLFRYSRPMKMSVVRLFVAPVIFLAMTVIAIWAGQQTQPAPAWIIAAAVAIGIVFGVPLGLAMSAHRTVRRTEKPHVMYVDPSWITAAIWVGAFILRAAIRLLLPVSALGTIVGDGLLLFGISAVVTSYWVLYRKFRALDEAPQAS